MNVKIRIKCIGIFISRCYPNKKDAPPLEVHLCFSSGYVAFPPAMFVFTKRLQGTNAPSRLNATF